jgi:outer membrane protein assembly factor BamE (lipoprotein component of BamABCDE complex)
MTALRQVLHPKYFEQVRPGMSVAEVRALLGRPAVKEAYALKKEEVWDWRWLDGPSRKLFRVTFDFDGRVVSAATLDDPRELHQGGR